MSEIEINDKVMLEGVMFRVNNIVAGAASLVEFPYYSNSATKLVPLDELSVLDEIQAAEYVVKVRQKELDRRQKLLYAALNELSKAKEAAE